MTWTHVGDPALTGRRVVWCGDGESGAICPAADYPHREMAIEAYIETFHPDDQDYVRRDLRAGVIYDYDPEKRVTHQLDEAAEWRVAQWFWT